MTTAFQANAFQNNAFQIVSVVIPPGIDGGLPRRLHEQWDEWQREAREKDALEEKDRLTRAKEFLTIVKKGAGEFTPEIQEAIGEAVGAEIGHDDAGAITLLLFFP